ncbi:hypothetical protein B1B_04136, partial [mine drainage metagenome]
MDLGYFGLSGNLRKTTVILGAGASRGAEFVKSQVGILPPLDLDFFQQVARLNNCREADSLLAFVQEEYRGEPHLSMERFFSEADYTDRFHAELHVDRGPRVKRYRRALTDFYVVVARLLSESADKTCTFHESIADRLSANDSILSFNYDCIMDSALRDAGGNRWDPARGGYGCDIKGAVSVWRQSTQGRPPQGSIQLLKMHGSLNWEVAADATVSLRPAMLKTSAEGAIIPPSWFKDLTRKPFASIWGTARKALRSARILIVVGYSVPATDLFSQSLLKVEVGAEAILDAVVLVNPDREARRRFIDIIRDGLNPKTRVLEYSTLRELHDRLTLGKALL